VGWVVWITADLAHRQKTKSRNADPGSWFGSACALFEGDLDFLAGGRWLARDLRLPGFPVELGGFGKLHAPFLAQRHTCGLVQRCGQEIRVRS